MTHLSRKHNIAHAEQLELRILPTVKVNFNPNNGLLKITGDNSNNIVEIDGLAFSDLELFIDGNLFDQFDNVQKIKVNLKGGDDQFHISAFQYNGATSVKFGQGADLLDIDDEINLGSGADVRTEIRDFKADFGGNAGDLAQMDGGVRIQGDVEIKRVADVDCDGDGIDSTVENDDVQFKGDTVIQLSGLGDVDGDGFEVELDNIFASGGDVFLIVGSNFTDRINISRSKSQGDFKIDLRNGDDLLRVDNGGVLKNSFINNLSLFDGGTGDDTLLLGVDNDFGSPPTILNFETVV